MNVSSISFGSPMNPRSMIPRLFKYRHVTEIRHLDDTPRSNVLSISNLSMHISKGNNMAYTIVSTEQPD
jgi:hypothetical protein